MDGQVRATLGLPGKGGGVGEARGSEHAPRHGHEVPDAHVAKTHLLHRGVGAPQVVRTRGRIGAHKELALIPTGRRLIQSPALTPGDHLGAEVHPHHVRIHPCAVTVSAKQPTGPRQPFRLRRRGQGAPPCAVQELPRLVRAVVVTIRGQELVDALAGQWRLRVRI